MIFIIKYDEIMVWCVCVFGIFLGDEFDYDFFSFFCLY